MLNWVNHAVILPDFFFLTDLHNVISSVITYLFMTYILSVVSLLAFSIYRFWILICRFYVLYNCDTIIGIKIWGETLAVEVFTRVSLILTFCSSPLLLTWPFSINWALRDSTILVLWLGQ